MKPSYNNPAWQNLIKLIAKKVASEIKPEKKENASNNLRPIQFR